MEGKRPLGVSVLGWFFIVAGAFGFSGILVNAKDYPHFLRMEFRASLMFLLSGMLAIAGIACGVFLLRLRAWARKLAIILCLANIALALANFRLAPLKAKNQQAFEKNEQLIRERYKPQYQEQALEEYRKIKEAGDKALPVVLGFMVAFQIAWNSAIIYYLSRPRIQEYFGESEEAGASNPQ